jgi:hypothetical protein
MRILQFAKLHKSTTKCVKRFLSTWWKVNFLPKKFDHFVDWTFFLTGGLSCDFYLIFVPQPTLPTIGQGSKWLIDTCWTYVRCRTPSLRSTSCRVAWPLRQQLLQVCRSPCPTHAHISIYNSPLFASSSDTKTVFPRGEQQAPLCDELLKGGGGMRFFILGFFINQPHQGPWFTG